uniref:Uncharacterized protein n=1 Tax=Acrobeloides nanus TaxID=290746 RepID=A0A914CRP1_9BILA
MYKKDGWHVMDWMQFVILVLLLLAVLAILTIMIVVIVRVEQITHEAGNFLHSGSPIGSLLSKLFSPSN